VNLSLRSSMYSPSRKEIQLRYRCIQFLLRNREDAVFIAKYGYAGASLRRTFIRYR